MWPTTYYQPGTFLITSDTPVAAAQPGLQTHGLNINVKQSSAPILATLSEECYFDLARVI